MGILTIYGSSRRNGNSEILADSVVKNLQSTKIYLTEYNIQPLVDQRHTSTGFQRKNDDYYQIIELIKQHDLLLFATPLYWYGMSGLLKNFIDRWSESLRDPCLNFRSEMGTKKAYVVITGSDKPLLKALPLVEQFNYIFEFLDIDFQGYIIGEGNKPGEVLNDSLAMTQARELNTILSISELI